MPRNTAPPSPTKIRPVFLPPVIRNFPVLTAYPVSPDTAPAPTNPGPSLTNVPFNRSPFDLSGQQGEGGIVVSFPAPGGGRTVQLDPNTGFPLELPSSGPNTTISIPNPLPKVKCFSVTHTVGATTDIALFYENAAPDTIEGVPYAEASFIINLLRQQTDIIYDSQSKRLITR